MTATASLGGVLGPLTGVSGRAAGGRRAVLLGAACLVAVSAATAGAAAPPAGARIVSVQLGLAGRAKVGYWTPVRLEIAAGARSFRGRVALRAEDGDGVAVAYVDPPEMVLELPARAKRAVWRYVRLGRRQGPVAAELLDEQGEVIAEAAVRRTPASVWEATRQWVVSVGADVGVEQALRRRRPGTADAFAVTRVRRADQLPDRWWGYDAVDWLVLPSGDPQLVESLSERQVEAIDHWVRLGGRLLVSCGRNAPRLARPGGRLARWAPGPFADVIQLRSTPGLESWVGAVQRLAAPEGPPLVLSLFDRTEGRVELHEGVGAAGDQPALIRRAYGFGVLVFAAFDLDQPPVAGWSSRPQLLNRLLAGDAVLEEDRSADAVASRVTHVGYNDLAGQLRSALDQFDGAPLTPFSWVAGLLLLYAGLIGPVDYWLARRSDRRPVWSWASFAVLLGLFTAAAAVGAARLKQKTLAVNEAELMDVDLASGWVRGAYWAHVYSPRSDRYRLGLRAVPLWEAAAAARTLLTWQGLPGGGLGGLDAGGRPPLDASYTAAAAPDAQAGRRPVLDGLPIQPRATKALAAQWWALGGGDAAAAGEPTLRQRDDGLLEGYVRNPLTEPLRDPMLYYDGWAWRLDGPLAPGAVARVAGNPLNLRWRLTRRRLVEMNEVGVPWDIQSRDTARILEMIMFHEAAGGRNYTRLSHRYHGRLDLSPALRLNRAVLVGGVDRGPARLLRDGRPLEAAGRRRTICRVVLPVRPAETPYGKGALP